MNDMNDVNEWKKHEKNGHPHIFMMGVYTGTTIFKAIIFQYYHFKNT